MRFPAWDMTAEDIKTRGYSLDVVRPHVVAGDLGERDALDADAAHRVETAE